MRFQWFCNLLRYTRIARFDRDGDVLMGIGGAHERGQMSRVAEQAEITGGFLYTNVTNTSAQSATAGAGDDTRSASRTTAYVVSRTATRTLSSAAAA